jgi:hypothetical protein
MAKVFETIDDSIREWINNQKMFFVASAPLSGDGMVNCSPKGLDTFRILGPRKIAYLDYTGSGAETIAHLRENGRIVIMMCAFEGRPRIMRFHGVGKAHETGSKEFESLSRHFDNLTGARAMIVIEVHRIGDSCGYAVPRYQYVDNRDGLNKWAEQKGEEGITRYQREKNRVSLDGLPAMHFPD